MDGIIYGSIVTIGIFEGNGVRDEHQSLPLCSDELLRIHNEADDDKKKLFIIFLGESIHNSNEGQTWM